MTVLKRIEKINDYLDVIVYWLLVCMVGAMAGIAFFQVIGRNVIKYTPAWMEEVCRFLLIWSSYLGSAAMLRKSGHTSVSVAVNRLPFQARRAVALFVDLCMLIFYGILAWYGAGLVQRYLYRTAETVPMSMSWIYLCFPVSFGLMVIYSIEEIVRLLAAPEQVARLQNRIEDADMILAEDSRRAEAKTGEV